MRHLGSPSFIATALLLGALACSDESSSDPLTGRPDPLNPANGGSSGQAASSGGSSAGQASSTGGAGPGAAGSGAGGSPAGAGGSPAAGAGGAPAADAGADSGLPTPDKLVALTFDDGPDPTATGLVLDKLEAHGVPASFFLIGQQIDAGDAAVLQRAEDLGCEFENHSQGFGSLNASTEQQIDDSINATNAAILAATGQTAVFFRPPNLAVSQLMHDTIDMPFASGILGNDFPGGSCGSPPTVECVSNAVLNNVQDGSIILLHDVQPLPHPTPEALDVIIPALKEQGYEFVTLRQLFARRGVDPSSNEGNMWVTVPPPAN